MRAWTGGSPDALDPAFDQATFAAALAGSRRTAKSALMDQSLVAGVGNIYSDEILFQAQLHPKAPCRSSTMNSSRNSIAP